MADWPRVLKVPWILIFFRKKVAELGVEVCLGFGGVGFVRGFGLWLNGVSGVG